MAEPQIRYCTTSDGVRIAYGVHGSGPQHLVVVAHPATPWLFSAPGRSSPSRWERGSTSLTVIAYDGRGTGLSQRDAADFGLAARVADLDAVVDHAGSRTHALFAAGLAAPTAIAYAAREPSRVTHLMLWGAAARPRDILDTPRVRALVSMATQDWDLFLNTAARVLLAWSESESKEYARALRETTTLEVWLEYTRADTQIDTTDLLAQVRAPTLVGYEREGFASLEVARDLVARIPNARLQLVDGPGFAFVAEDRWGPIEEFLGVSSPDQIREARAPSDTAIILFTDIVDSTALTEQLGDAVFRARASRLDGAMRAGIRECGGTPVEGKVLGDGVMAVFTAARQAIEAAFRCRAAADGTGLALHMGIHAGDVTREGANVYGGAVNVASRICGLSANDEILVSATVRELARTSAAASFDDRGAHELKGIAEAVHVYAVRPGSA